MREEGQWELKVTRGRMSGRVVVCARMGLKRTNMVALGTKGRAGRFLETDLAKDSKKGPICLEWQ